MLPSVHDDHARVSFIDKQTFRYTNNTVSDYFHLKTDLLFEETKSGKALASLVAPSPTPLQLCKSFARGPSYGNYQPAVYAFLKYIQVFTSG